MPGAVVKLLVKFLLLLTPLLPLMVLLERLNYTVMLDIALILHRLKKYFWLPVFINLCESFACGKGWTNRLK
jgi:hypothetical protein